MKAFAVLNKNSTVNCVDLSPSSAKSSSSPRFTPGTDAKKEFEDMRQMHGKDWLLALHNPYEPVSKPPVPSNQTAEPHNTTTNAKLGSLNHEDGTRRHVQVDVHVERDGDADRRGPAVVVEEVVERTSMPSEESAGSKSIDGVKCQVKGQEDNEGVRQLERQASDEQYDLLMRQESQLQIRMNDGDLNEEDDHDEEEDGKPKALESVKDYMQYNKLCRLVVCKLLSMQIFR